MSITAGSRPTEDEYFLEMARLAAGRSTCARRSVGCVLTNVHGHVMATGRNGVHAKAPHCTESPCPGAGLPSGEGLHLCQSIHAEVNALLQCSDIMQIHSVYCTASPCVHCMRLIANTSAKRIVFLDEYPHPESKQIAERLGIAWIKH